MIDNTREIDNYLKQLFPINRSITGEGNRQTLKALQAIAPIDIIEYPTGLRVFDWKVPKEWNANQAWIKNSRGEKIVDFKNNNLHLLGYSSPVHQKMTLEQLSSHLYFLKKMPSAIPYRTSYYQEKWGFCLSYDQFQKDFNPNDLYEVFIDSELKNGSLTIGEILIPGSSSQEILISTYICHPSLANDNLSGPILTAFLSRELIKKKNNLTYRIIFVPETIGAIAYCANNEEVIRNIQQGLVVTSVGGPGLMGYKQSFDQQDQLNQIIQQVFEENNTEYITYPFDPLGSDERQYSSQGFRINIASITKDKYYEYDYYHTSLDNLDFVKPEYINQSLDFHWQVIDRLDKNLTFKNCHPNCEVMLSKYDLYPKTGGIHIPGQTHNNSNHYNETDIILWCLFLFDGEHNLLQISDKIGIPFDIIYQLALKLEENQIVRRV